MHSDKSDHGLSYVLVVEGLVASSSIYTLAMVLTVIVPVTPMVVCIVGSRGHAYYMPGHMPLVNNSQNSTTAVFIVRISVHIHKWINYLTQSLNPDENEFSLACTGRCVLTAVGLNLATGAWRLPGPSRIESGQFFTRSHRYQIKLLLVCVGVAGATAPTSNSY